MCTFRSGARGPLPIRVGTCGWWCTSGRIKRKLEYLGGWICSVLPPRVWLLGLEARVLAVLFSSFLCRRFVLVSLYITVMVYMHVSRSIDRSISRLIGWFVGGCCRRVCWGEWSVCERGGYAYLAGRKSVRERKMGHGAWSKQLACTRRRPSSTVAAKQPLRSDRRRPRRRRRVRGRRHA